MAIIVAKTSAEKYAKLAKVVCETESDLLNGRSDKGYTTKLRANKLKFLIDRHCTRHGVIVDVGCGDGQILEIIAEGSFRAFGIIPSKMEYEFVSNLRKGSFIKLLQGTTLAIPLDDNSADIIVCNNVLHGTGFSDQLFDKSLTEFRRLLKPNGKLLLGEFPCINEFEGRTYGTSIALYLLHLVSHHKFKILIKESLSLLAGLVTDNHYVVNNTNGFFLDSGEVERRGNYFGFELIERKPSLEKTSGTVKRFDYLFNKVK